VWTDYTLNLCQIFWCFQRGTLFSHLSLKKGALFILKLSLWVSSLIHSQRFVTFWKEGVITEQKKKTYQGSSDSSKIIVGHFIRCSWRHFSVKMAILWEKQNLWCEIKIQWKWNKLRGKWQYFKCEGNHVSKRRQNARFRTFYWKSRGEANSIWPKKKCDK
jgi:hypothetical protein